VAEKKDPSGKVLVPPNLGGEEKKALSSQGGSGRKIVGMRGREKNLQGEKGEFPKLGERLESLKRLVWGEKGGNQKRGSCAQRKEKKSDSRRREKKREF